MLYRVKIRGNSRSYFFLLFLDLSVSGVPIHEYVSFTLVKMNDTAVKLGVSHKDGYFWLSANKLG